MAAFRAYTVHAIVLKRRNMGEADRLLTVFSREYGRMRVYARGIRRVHSRRAAHVEVFSHVTLVLHRGKTWDTLMEAQTIETFLMLRERLPMVSAGYYLCELVDALLPERQEQRDVYALLRDGLATLNGTVQKDPVALSEQFALELLRRLGYLARDGSMPHGQIEPYIERIVEKRIHSHRLLTKLANER